MRPDGIEGGCSHSDDEVSFNGGAIAGLVVAVALLVAVAVVFAIFN